ncbi:MAG: hypothetical protein GF393_05770, partial [Armatimonadia bacterium]|nr:hypothetical protein [Armatimonadia bacterium]
MLPRTVVRVLLMCLLASSLPAVAAQWQFPAGEEPVADPMDVVFTVNPGDAGEQAGRAQIALCMQDDANYYYADLGPEGVLLGRSLDGKRTALTPRVPLPPGRRAMAIQR